MNHMLIESWSRQQNEITAREQRAADSAAHKLVAAALMLAVMVFAAIVLSLDKPRDLGAVCATDSECQQFCQVDDRDCDGGR